MLRLKFAWFELTSVALCAISVPMSAMEYAPSPSVMAWCSWLTAPNVIVSPALAAKFESPRNASVTLAPTSAGTVMVPTRTTIFSAAVPSLVVVKCTWVSGSMASAPANAFSTSVVPPFVFFVATVAVSSPAPPVYRPTITVLLCALAMTLRNELTTSTLSHRMVATVGVPSR